PPAYAGAGVQSIAFATDDIFDTAAILRRLGMEFLSIPPNYYDDLGARYGLDDAVLAHMAEFNILYDEDPGGGYHYLYTRAFVKRFFFEIVQRRAYDGYGARNTAIRLAAQSRFKNVPAAVPRPHDSRAAPEWCSVRGWLAERRKPRRRLRVTSSPTTPSVPRPTSWP